MNTNKFCEHCGAPLNPGVRFCESCGQAVPGAGVPQASGAPPQQPPPPEPTYVAPRPQVAPPPRPVSPPPYMPPPVRPAPPKPPARSNRTILIVVLVILALCCLCCVVGGVAYRWLGPAISDQFTTFEIPIPVEITAVPELPEIAAPGEVTEIPELPPVEETAAPVEVTEAPTEPAPAPETQANMSYEGVSFYLDPAVAAAAGGEIVPAATGNDIPPWELVPEHLLFTINGYAVPQHYHNPVILVYPVDAYLQANPEVQNVFDKFSDVMSYQPVVNPVDGMPFLPTWNAAQVIVSSIKYLDFEPGSGVRYLTQYGQDVYPVNNDSLFYTFQGMTHDGKWYVAAILPVNNPGLPDPETILADPNFYDNFPKYIEETVLLLDEMPAASFTPSLDALDELFTSLIVQK